MRRFKLCLASDYRTEKESDIPFLLPGQSPVDAIADYLQVFHDYVSEEMEKTGANRYSREQYRYVRTMHCLGNNGNSLIMALVPHCSCYMG